MPAACGEVSPARLRQGLDERAGLAELERRALADTQVARVVARVADGREALVVRAFVAEAVDQITLAKGDRVRVEQQCAGWAEVAYDTGGCVIYGQVPLSTLVMATDHCIDSEARVEFIDVTAAVLEPSRQPRGAATRPSIARR